MSIISFDEFKKRGLQKQADEGTDREPTFSDYMALTYPEIFKTVTDLQAKSSPEDVKNYKKMNRSENFGGFANFAGATTAGALIGGALSKDDPGFGATIGAGIGASTGIIGQLAHYLGMIRKARTDEEQAEHDRSGSRLSNYLIPGYAMYNNGRRNKYLMYKTLKNQIKKGQA